MDLYTFHKVYVLEKGEKERILDWPTETGHYELYSDYNGVKLKSQPICRKQLAGAGASYFTYWDDEPYYGRYYSFKIGIDHRIRPTVKLVREPNRVHLTETISIIWVSTKVELPSIVQLLDDKVKEIGTLERKIASLRELLDRPNYLGAKFGYEQVQTLLM